MSGSAWSLREHRALGRFAVKWVVIAAPVAGVIGSACALFLWALERATEAREGHPGLLYLLPVAGAGIVLGYRWFGGRSERGTNLIMDEIHSPGEVEGGVPARMGVFVLVATVVTHLFGGSAGREGTAVQIGGSVAAEAGRRLRLSREDVVLLLMVGMSAGFAGVFGTPLAAAVFAMEVLTVGRLRFGAVWPCLVAGIVGDEACQAWGIHHTAYHIAVAERAFEWGVAGKVVVAALAFGLASVVFARFTHGLAALWKRVVPVDWIRPVLGGGVVIGLVWVVGTRDYLGLGVTSPDPRGVSIVSSFSAGGATTWSWAWKIVFTAVTLSCGFKGGEVTPLFFVGATLGNVLSRAMGAPTDLFAGLGFVAVFAGATNTPLACTIMGIELFGAGHAGYLAIACFVAFLASGHGGIYTGQRRVGAGELGAL